MTSSLERKERKFRVAEVFGPTIQGEGRNVGAPCYFIRFGGCDFRCSWCDSPHAVLPDQVDKLDQLTQWEIIERLNELGATNMSPTWVVLTGGNPGLLNLDSFIDILHGRMHKVMVETQGSAFRPWFGKVDDLCFSPKPPSSGMEWDFSQFERVLMATLEAQATWAKENDREVPRPYLKVPIFTEEDLEFAATVKDAWWAKDLQMFLSIGNDDPTLPTISNPDPTPRTWDMYPKTSEIILAHQRHWTERILTDQRFDEVRIFPQQHVLMWGNERGR